jgi:RNA polymerase subunit RPABC4/transcription elongation factor Spt4
MELSKLDGSERVRWRDTKHSDLLLSRIVCGYTRREIERIIQKRQSRCMKCGGRDFTYESGYPGETFRVCVDCHHINDSHMDFSAIE